MRDFFVASTRDLAREALTLAPRTFSALPFMATHFPLIPSCALVALLAVCEPCSNPRQCRIYHPSHFLLILSLAVRRIISTTSSNENPAAAAALGIRLNSVIPGMVLTSRQ